MRTHYMGFRQTEETVNFNLNDKLWGLAKILPNLQASILLWNLLLTFCMYKNPEINEQTTLTNSYWTAEYLTTWPYTQMSFVGWYGEVSTQKQ